MDKYDIKPKQVYHFIHEKKKPKKKALKVPYWKQKKDNNLRLDTKIYDIIIPEELPRQISED